MKGILGCWYQLISFWTLIWIMVDLYLFFIWAIHGLFWDYYCTFFKVKYNRRIDNQLGISRPCWRGLSSSPGFVQQQDGVQGRFAPLSLGYLQAGVVTLAPTAVDTMSSWYSVGYIEDGLACNFEEQNRSRTRTDQGQEQNIGWSVKITSPFSIEQFSSLN